jgi:hypothetical protein
MDRLAGTLSISLSNPGLENGADLRFPIPTYCASFSNLQWHHRKGGTEAQPPLGLIQSRSVTQGSSLLPSPLRSDAARATLGFGAESGWDSQNVDVKDLGINGLILRARGYIFRCEIGQRAFHYDYERVRRIHIPAPVAPA